MSGRAQKAINAVRRHTEATAPILGLVVACVLLPVIASSKQSTPQMLRVNTRLVVVNVVAHNKKGEPVKNLAQRDFTVLDNGKRQQISVFAIDRYHILQAPVRLVSSNVFSNRLVTDGRGPSSAVVILLDGVETQLVDSVFARNQIIKFLRQIPRGDRVGLYVLGKLLSVIQDITGNASPLLEALRHGSPESEAPSKASQGQAPEITSKTLAIESGDASAQLSDRLFHLAIPRRLP